MYVILSRPYTQIHTIYNITRIFLYGTIIRYKNKINTRFILVRKKFVTQSVGHLSIIIILYSQSSGYEQIRARDGLGQIMKNNKGKKWLQHATFLLLFFSLSIDFHTVDLPRHTARLYLYTEVQVYIYYYNKEQVVYTALCDIVRRSVGTNNNNNGVGGQETLTSGMQRHDDMVARYYCELLLSSRPRRRTIFI